MKQVNPNWQNARRGIVGAVTVAVQRKMDGEKACAVVLPTRYGKTDVARVLACILHSRGLAPYVVVVSPALVLRKNVANSKKWIRALRRYGIPTNTMTPRSVRDVPTPERMDVAATFLSVTVQMIQTQADCLGDWVSAVERIHGARPLFIFDECHMMGAANEWGKVVQQLIDMGCYVVLMSATPFRSDGLEIPGARYRETEREDYVRPVCSEGSRPDYLLVQLYEGTYSHREMIPDFQLKFHEAWEEPELPMCHIGLNRLRVDVRELTNDLYATLEEIPEGECRQILAKVVRDPRVVEAAVRRLVQTLSQLKKDVPEAQAMVFVSGRSFEDTVDDQHLRMVSRELQKQCPTSWKIVSATQDTEDANDAILAFCGNHDAKIPVYGLGDVLVLKNMGSLGIDAPQTKVILDLSPMRTLASWIQRVMRGATRYLNFETFELITPADVLSAANVSWLTNGGAIGLKIREDEELRTEYEVKKKEKPMPVWQVDKVEQGDFLDSKGNIADARLAKTVDALFERIPSLPKVVSRAELGAALAGSMSTPSNDAEPTEEPPDDMDDQVRALSKVAHNLVKQIVNSRHGYRKDRPEEYGERCKAVMNSAKSASGCQLGVDTTNYTPKQLEALIAKLRSMLNGDGADARAS